jgi:hypothetical protein
VYATVIAELRSPVRDTVNAPGDWPASYALGVVATTDTAGAAAAWHDGNANEAMRVRHPASLVLA